MKALYTLIAGTALALSACKDKADPAIQSKAPEPKQEAAAIPKPVFPVPDTFKAALGKVFEGYARVQSALAQDSLAKAKEAFSSMHALLHMMPKDGLDSSAKADWDSTDVKIMAVLHPMATAETLDSIRVHFMDFSQILIESVGKYGIATEAPIYQFHCPMAKGNQGADWLQSDSVLSNPYFGKAMLTCGNRVKKIDPS
jgi:membrane fusion protein, copper/silver efflux system